MPAVADSLREIHSLHQRAKALRDRLASGPKTLAARQTALANRQAELEKARKAFQDAKVQLKKHEHTIQAIDTKVDDLRVKLNLVKKNEEYKALQNQIAAELALKSKIEDETLLGYEAIETQGAALEALEAETKKFADEVETFKKQIDEQSGPQTEQLREIEAALTASENAIPEDHRERYRRTVRQFGADAMAAVEDGACHGCYTSLTPQGLSEVLSRDTLNFCKSCGRLLYLAEAEVSTTQPTTARR
jgi:predicted  nucleic acid-binding Zn-ribbon protein